MGIVPQIVHEKPGESPVPRCFIENRARWVRNCAWAQMKVGPKSGVFGHAGSTKAPGGGCLASIGAVCLGGACCLAPTRAVVPPVPRCFIENRARWVRNCAWAQMKVGPKSGVLGTCRVHKSTWGWVFGFDWSTLFAMALLVSAFPE